MGIRTDPGYELFDNDCLACFAPGQTPKKIFASFSGLELIVPGFPAADFYMPTGWVLEQSPGVPCEWVGAFGAPWEVVYQANIAGTAGIIYRYLGLWIFESVGAAPCTTSFANQLLPAFPAVIATEGRAQVFWRPETDSPSIKGVMAKLNIEPHRNTMFEGFPLDDTHAVAKYCRTRDSTNIKIKFEI